MVKAKNSKASKITPSRKSVSKKKAYSAPALLLNRAFIFFIVIAITTAGLFLFNSSKENETSGKDAVVLTYLSDAKVVADKYDQGINTCNYELYVDSLGFTEESYEAVYGSPAETAKTKFQRSCSENNKLEYVTSKAERQSGVGIYDESSEAYLYYFYYKVVSEDANNNGKINKTAVVNRLDGKLVVMPTFSSTITQAEFDALNLQ